MDRKDRSNKDNKIDIFSYVFKILSTVILILWILFIFRNSSETAAVSSRRSQAWVILLKNLFPEGVLRKLAHLFEYTVLGILLKNFFNCIKDTVHGIKENKINIILSAVFGIIIATIDELIQYNTAGRSAQVSDVLLDFSGVLLGIIFFQVLCIIIDFIKKRKRK